MINRHFENAQFGYVQDMQRQSRPPRDRGPGDVTMKRLINALILTTMLGVFVGGLVVMISWNSPEPHVPYKGVTLPNGVHIFTSQT